MKKILTYSFVLLLALVLVACGPKQTLRVLIPTEYIDESLVRDFEREYGVRVALIPFDSNEIAITQIQSNSYDLVIPSDYAVEELVDKDLILEMDYSKFTNFSKSDFDSNLQLVLNTLKDEGFDLLKYGVPYFWGNVGILYDTNKVSLSFLQANGWNALANQNYNVMLYDSSRDMFMVALKALYGEDIDINNPTDLELAAAEQWLKDAAGPNADFLTDEVFDVMLKPAQYDMAVVYSGDGVYLMYENDDLGYFVPEEGTNVWVDTFAIP
jgi:spermidine/putrescine transport system substrate-binding protein